MMKNFSVSIRNELDTKYRLVQKPLAYLIGLSVIMTAYCAQADDYFNPEGIDNFSGAALSDLSEFSHPGGELPGTYRVDIYINSVFVESKSVQFDGPGTSLQPELTKAQLLRYGVSKNASPQFNQLPIDSVITDLGKLIDKAFTHYNFSQQRLDISIPQAAILHMAQDSEPPEKWDHGLNMLFTDYNYSGSSQWAEGERGNEQVSYLNLHSGANLGNWRFRHYATMSDSQSGFRWQNISSYAQRDITPLRSLLTVGDSYTPSDVFDSFSYRGMELASNDNMLSDSERGFAPVIRGIAQSNAQVTIRQAGNIIYQSYVPPGAFTINDLYPTSSSGSLEVTIKEADGSIRRFVQPFSAVPIMQREGRLKYAITTGELRQSDVQPQKSHFLMASGIYGLAYDSTIYSGGISAEQYQSAAVGVGKGLGYFGSASADITYARTNNNLVKDQGYSLRFQYGKDFNFTGTSFTLAGYRYSSSGFYDFGEANGFRMEPSFSSDQGEVNQLHDLNYSYNKKGRTQINVSQSMNSWGSLYISGYQQSYWGTNGKESSLSAGYSQNISGINYNVNYNYSHSLYMRESDQVISLSLQVPFSLWSHDNTTTWANFSSSVSRKNDMTAQAGIGGTMLADNNLSYNISQGYGNHGQDANGNLNANYRAPWSELSAGYSYTPHSKTINYGASGGIVLHPYGLTLSQSLGDTMALVRAPEASHVKIENQTGVYTDYRGYAVIPYVSAYRQNRISLDTSTLDDETDLPRNVVSVIPTQGALVLADFNTFKGKRVLFSLTRGNVDIPFGAIAKLVTPSGDSNISGIISERGQAYLSGMPQKGTLSVSWNGAVQCQVPFVLPDSSDAVLQVSGICH